MRKGSILILTLFFYLPLNELFSQRSRIDLEYGLLNTSFNETLVYGRGSESFNTIKHGIILSYRYKFHLFSNLDLGFNLGYFHSEFYYNGIITGGDLKYSFYEPYFIDISFRQVLGLILLNRGTDHSPDRRNLYYLISIGIGRTFSNEFGLSAHLLIPSRSLVGKKYRSFIGYQREEYMYSIYSLKISYYF